jgi:hypothetical protein
MQSYLDFHRPQLAKEDLFDHESETQRDKEAKVDQDLGQETTLALAFAIATDPRPQLTMIAPLLRPICTAAA